MIDTVVTFRMAVETDVARLFSFVCDFRRDLYPMLDHSQLPEDLREFKKHYLDSRYCGGYLAEDGAGDLIGFIAMRRYDGRFKALFALEEDPVVEVQKLFVRPDFRRKGIASRLFQGLYDIAIASGVKSLYLHTHPFLPGAESFWEKQGFQIIHREVEPVYRTIHMVSPVSLGGGQESDSEHASYLNPNPLSDK